MTKLRYFIVIFLFATALTACTQRQVIKYPMEKVTSPSNSMFQDAILAVQPFEDDREPLTSCSGEKVAKVEVDERIFYYNCDQHYESDSVSREITKRIADHLDHAHLFKKVTLSEVTTPQADYMLAGKVTRFEGLKEYRPAAVVVSKFGPVGSMITN